MPPMNVFMTTITLSLLISPLDDDITITWRRITPLLLTPLLFFLPLPPRDSHAAAFGRPGCRQVFLFAVISPEGRFIPIRYRCRFFFASMPSSPVFFQAIASSRFSIFSIDCRLRC